MSHLRTQIRDAVVEAITGLATTGDNVFKSRTFPVNESNLPGLLVYTPLDSVDDETSALTCSNARVLSVNIIANYHGQDESVLDQIELEVNRALVQGLDIGQLSGLVDHIKLVSSTISFEGEAGKETGELLTEYDMWYRTTFENLDTAF